MNFDTMFWVVFACVCGAHAVKFFAEKQKHFDEVSIKEADLRIKRDQVLAQADAVSVNAYKVGVGIRPNSLAKWAEITEPNQTVVAPVGVFEGLKKGLSAGPTKTQPGPVLQKAVARPPMVERLVAKPDQILTRTPEGVVLRIFRDLDVALVMTANTVRGQLVPSQFSDIGLVVNAIEIVREQIRADLENKFFVTDQEFLGLLAKN